MKKTNQNRKEVRNVALIVTGVVLLGLTIVAIIIGFLLHGTRLPFTEQRDYWRWYAAGSIAVVAVFEIVATSGIIVRLTTKDKYTDYRKRGFSNILTFALTVCMGFNAIVAIFCAVSGYISYFPWTEQTKVFNLYFLSLFNIAMIVAMMCAVTVLTVKLVKDNKKKG